MLCVQEYRVHAKSSSKAISVGQWFVAASRCWQGVRHRSGAVCADGAASPNRCSYQDDTYRHVEIRKRGEGLVSACASDW